MSDFSPQRAQVATTAQLPQGQPNWPDMELLVLLHFESRLAWFEATQSPGLERALQLVGRPHCIIATHP